jgi:guanylate kinase
VVNDDLEKAAAALKTIAQAARLKIPGNTINEFTQKWEDID